MPGHAATFAAWARMERATERRLFTDVLEESAAATAKEGVEETAVNTGAGQHSAPRGCGSPSTSGGKSADARCADRAQGTADEKVSFIFLKTLRGISAVVHVRRGDSIKRVKQRVADKTKVPEHL